MVDSVTKCDGRFRYPSVISLDVTCDVSYEAPSLAEKSIQPKEEVLLGSKAVSNLVSDILSSGKEWYLRIHRKGTRSADCDIQHGSSHKSIQHKKLR